MPDASVEDTGRDRRRRSVELDPRGRCGTGATAAADRIATIRPVATGFTKIINGELPGRFVWSDDQVVAFLSINPLGPGHVLVVPREEVDQWLDAPEGLFDRVMTVARAIGSVIRDTWSPPRVALMVAGFEVPHLHVHV